VRGSGDDDGGSLWTFGSKNSTSHTITVSVNYSKDPYGKSSTVRPKGIALSVWKRVS
jgi:hypothetical protein